MDIVYIVLAVIAGLFLLLLIVAATKPAAFRIERSMSIKAPPEKIFPLITNFHSWGGWSPWENIDPNLKRTYSGPASGKGAVYEWEGPKAGKGRMEILDAPASSKVTIKLDFLKPFEAHNTAEFTLQSSGGTTTVTWAMFGPQAFIGKVMCVFINMDKMLGKNFEQGLASMKTLAEK